MTDRTQELYGLLRVAVEDAAPLNLRAVKEEAMAQGFTAREVSLSLMRLMSSGEAVLDRNMELVASSPENPFYEFG